MADNIVMVEIPVSREAAAALSDPRKRDSVGRLVSSLVNPSSTGDDPLFALITQIKREARADGLTDEQIEAELAAYNAERRI
jgi:hypothetical protein